MSMKKLTTVVGPHAAQEEPRGTALRGRQRLRMYYEVHGRDFYGYSMGAGIALNNDGYHPGHLDAMESITADMLRPTPFYEEYARLNPAPGSRRPPSRPCGHLC